MSLPVARSGQSYGTGQLFTFQRKLETGGGEEQPPPTSTVRDSSPDLSAICASARRKKVAARTVPDDRRVQKTLASLREALVALIREKNYDSIRVSEILDRANVGRSTFYTHFRDKDDLLVSGIHDMLRSVQRPSAPPSMKLQEQLTWFSLPILEHHERHRHTGEPRMGSKGRAVLHDHLRKVLAEMIADDAKRNLRGRMPADRRIPSDLLVQYITSTFVLVLNWWLECRSPLPAAKVNDLFRALVLPTIAEITE